MTPDLTRRPPWSVHDENPSLRLFFFFFVLKNEAESNLAKHAQNPTLRTVGTINFSECFYSSLETIEEYNVV